MSVTQTLIQRFTNTRQAAGVEAVVSGEAVTFHFVLLSKKGNTIRIEKKEKAIDSAEALLKQIPAGIPVYLAVNGKGILHKKINAAATADAQALLSKVLPNAAASEFYLQHTTAGSELLVSVIRKQQLDDLLASLKPLPVVGCTLGSVAVAGIAPLLGYTDYRYDIITAAQRLTISDKHLLDVVNETASPENYSIGDDKISSTTITAYAAALSHFTGSRVQAGVPLLQQAQEEFKQQRIFKTAGGALLVFVLVLLLGNYFAFQHFWEKKNTLETQLALNGGELQRYQVLEKAITEKQQFLQSSGLLYASRTAYYADQLAAGMPESIALTRLNVSPRRQLQANDSIAFTPAEIQVEGQCKQSLELNNWMGKLKELNWVKQVVLKSYQRSTGNDYGTFVVITELK